MSDHLNFAQSIAKDAGKIMLRYFQIGVSYESKSDSSPVTLADKEINQHVINKITERYPTHSIIGEEDSLLQTSSEYSWVCDPLDGTRPFTYGIPINVFSLALTHQGIPILGVVYDPYMDRMYYAEKNKGAYLNNQKIRVNYQENLNKQHVGLSGQSNKLVNIITVANQININNGRIFILGSTVYDGIMVAAGQFIASIFTGKTAHDIAALKIIVEEAGGKVTDLSGNEQRYDQEINGAIISNNVIHNTVKKLIKSHLTNTI